MAADQTFRQVADAARVAAAAGVVFWAVSGRAGALERFWLLAGMVGSGVAGLLVWRYVERPR